MRVGIFWHKRRCQPDYGDVFWLSTPQQGLSGCGKAGLSQTLTARPARPSRLLPQLKQHRARSVLPFPDIGCFGMVSAVPQYDIGLPLSWLVRTAPMPTSGEMTKFSSPRQESNLSTCLAITHGNGAGAHTSSGPPCQRIAVESTASSVKFRHRRPDHVITRAARCGNTRTCRKRERRR